MGNINVFQIITGEADSNQYAESTEPNKTLYNGKENVMPIGSERQRKVFHAIEKACTDNTVSAIILISISSYITIGLG